MQIPVVLGCLLAAAWQSLPHDQKARKKRTLDLPGLIVLALMMASFLLFIDRANKGGILQPRLTFAFAVSFIVLAVIFAAIESFWAENPLVPPALIFKQRAGPNYAIQIFLLIAQFSVSPLFRWRQS